MSFITLVTYQPNIPCKRLFKSLIPAPLSYEIAYGIPPYVPHTINNHRRPFALLSCEHPR